MLTEETRTILLSIAENFDTRAKMIISNMRYRHRALNPGEKVAYTNQFETWKRAANYVREKMKG